MMLTTVVGFVRREWCHSGQDHVDVYLSVRWLFFGTVGVGHHEKSTTTVCLQLSDAERQREAAGLLA